MLEKEKKHYGLSNYIFHTFPDHMREDNFSHHGRPWFPPWKMKQKQTNKSESPDKHFHFYISLIHKYFFQATALLYSTQNSR